jgi:hypothetical protein
LADALTRPELTLPEAEAAALRAAYASAGVVLEYGSGGSTVMAAELGAKVFSVESDPDWAAMMQGWFKSNPAKGAVQIVHADIGPTRDWGHPETEAQFRKWPDYALKVWEQMGDLHPDVVLVDGRFRLGCFLTTAYQITRPVTLFFDDYTPRAGYHKAEEICPPAALIGRMARFDLTPATLSADRVRAYVRALLQPV